MSRRTSAALWLALIAACLLNALACCSARGQQIEGPSSFDRDAGAEYRFDVPVGDGERVFAFWQVPEPLWHREYGDVLVIAGPPGTYTLRVNAIVGPDWDGARKVSAALPVEITGGAVTPGPIPPPFDDDSPPPKPPPPTTWDGMADHVLRDVPSHDRPQVAQSILAGLDAVIAPPPGSAPIASGLDAAALYLDVATAREAAIAPDGMLAALVAIARCGDLLAKAPDAGLAVRYAQALRPRLTEIANGG